MQYTIRAVPDEIDRALRQRARRESKSLNAVVIDARGHRAHDAAVGKPPNERHRPLARGGKDGQDGEAAQSRCAPGRPSSTTNDARVEMGLPGRVTYSTTW